jgi:2-oxoglutarate ferredoxin oxidoreductase subunit alpha
MRTELVIGLAGSGGDGIGSAGEALLPAAASEGYHALMTKSFGPQIRGGESSCRVRISTDPVLNQGGLLDVAVALNWDDWLRFGSELPIGPASVVLYEAATGIAPGAIPAPVVGGGAPAACLAVPFAELARTHGGDRAKNLLVLGLIAGWFGLARDGILGGIRKRLGQKGEAVLRVAEDAFLAGLAHAEAQPLPAARRIVPPPPRAHGICLGDGNEVCAAAAIAAGCECFGGYPITPSSEIMPALARDLWSYGGALLQAEDEIAGIGCALGASYAGRRAMTATSGPGMSLKTEILGLATIATLAAEHKARAFFAAALSTLRDAQVRELFAELLAEEEEHIALVRAEQARLPAAPGLPPGSFADAPQAQ